MDPDSLSVDADERTYEIRIDRPSVENAMNRQVFTELAEVVRHAEQSSSRIVVITGTGDTFSAGGDIQAIRDTTDETGRDDLANWLAMLFHRSHIEAVLDLSKPLVTRVNGDAIGAGATLATLGDFVVAAADAQFRDPHVANVGYVCPDTVAFWPMFTDLHTTKRLLMTGESISAREARDAGLATYVVPREDLDAKVESVVTELASMPQPALRMTKMMTNRWLKRSSEYIRNEALALEAVSSQLPDHQEAVDAFLSGRRPEFPSSFRGGGG